MKTCVLLLVTVNIRNDVRSHLLYGLMKASGFTSANSIMREALYGKFAHVKPLAFMRP